MYLFTYKYETKIKEKEAMNLRGSYESRRRWRKERGGERDAVIIF